MSVNNRIGKNKDWLDSKGDFLFGKYKGKSLEDVRDDDPGYLRWIIDTVEDISDEDQEIIETILRLR